jgi:hypothetical protein
MPIRGFRTALISTDPPFIWAVSTAIVLSAALAVTQAIDFGVFDLRFRSLDSNTHASVFGIVSLLACAFAVIFSAIFAKRTHGAVPAILSGALAVILVLRVWSPPYVLVLALPFTVIALVMLWRQATGARGIVRTGCLLLIISFAIHIAESKASGSVVLNPDSWAYQIRCIVKHAAELSGWVLVAAGFLYLILEKTPRARRSTPRPRPGSGGDEVERDVSERASIA